MSWKALAAGAVLGIALGLWVLSVVSPRPPVAGPPDAGVPDAGPAPVHPALWALPELDLRLGPGVSEAFAYPVCGTVTALPAPGEADGGATVELGPAGGCAGAVVTPQMHPAMLEVRSQHSGWVETSHGWVPAGELPFVSTLVLEGTRGLQRAPLPLVNPRLAYRSPDGTDLVLFDDDGACALESPAEPGGLDGGALLPRPPALPMGRALRVRVAEGLEGARVVGGWRRTCE